MSARQGTVTLPRKKLLVLAGTHEARQLVEKLADTGAFEIIASLAGATKAPLSMAANVRTGGFGGAEGLAEYCRAESVDALVDVTHPFARHISRNAVKAAEMRDIPCFSYERPPWAAQPGDAWREFASWQDMVDAIPAGCRVFLAGGTASIEAFCARDDIHLWARALNVSGYNDTDKHRFLNAMPNQDMNAEADLFSKYDIELLCCKNAGGRASIAKIEAARSLGIPIWLLARAKRENNVPREQIHDNVEQLFDALMRFAGHATDAFDNKTASKS